MRDPYSKLSKFLSFILRHKPDAIGLTLDAGGWVDVDALLDAAQKSPDGKRLTRALLEEIVRTNAKKRFGFSEDGRKIRAHQGHSFAIDLGLEPKSPPKILYHGTAEKSIEEIFENGLKPMQRHHVHLSGTIETAHKVGQRHGKVVILTIDTQLCLSQGQSYYQSDNGVWLTDFVPAAALSVFKT